MQPPLPDRIEMRLIGPRLLVVVFAGVCFFGSLAMCAWYPALDQSEVMGTLTWLIGLMATTVVGETARPGGKSTSAFGITSKGGNDG
jgi:hypothetical protein